MNDSAAKDINANTVTAVIVFFFLRHKTQYTVYIIFKKNIF